MLKIIVCLFAIIVFISDQSDSTTTTPSNTCSNVGEVCGGHVAQPKVCCSGLECGPVEDLAIDKPGTCMKKVNKCSRLGETCGGKTIEPKVCCSGLECGPVEDLAIDKPGTCMKKVNTCSCSE